MMPYRQLRLAWVHGRLTGDWQRMCRLLENPFPSLGIGQALGRVPALQVQAAFASGAGCNLRN